MMRKFKLFAVFVLLALVMSAGWGAVLAQESPPIDVNPLFRDAQLYADHYGVSLDEAIRRLELQVPIGKVNAALVANERDTFAGLWIQHEPQFGVVVRFTRNGEETIQPYIVNGPLADIIEVRTAGVTLTELEALQAEITRAVEDLGIPANSGINVFENQVELYVTDGAQLDSALRAANMQLPGRVKVKEVAGLATEVTDIYAGLRFVAYREDCTTGFSVQHSSGAKGTTTARHCEPGPYYLGSWGGPELDYQGSAYGGSYDVMWLKAPGLAVRNLMYDGTYNRYVYSTKSRDEQALDEWVCKYGISTGYGCGQIVDKNFDPGEDFVGTFIRVHNPDNIDLAERGDSGGPWFWNNTAYGMMTHEVTVNGQPHPDAVYMAVNYFSFLDLTVLTE